MSAASAGPFGRISKGPAAFVTIGTTTPIPAQVDDCSPIEPMRSEGRCRDPSLKTGRRWPTSHHSASPTRAMLGSATVASDAFSLSQEFAGDAAATGTLAAALVERPAVR